MATTNPATSGGQPLPSNEPTSGNGADDIQLCDECWPGMDVTNLIREGREAALAASPGPWSVEHDGRWYMVNGRLLSIGEGMGPADAEFIAFARNNLPRLLELAEEGQRYKADLERIKAEGINPNMLRWCQWPGCLRSYEAMAGPQNDPGWMMHRRFGMFLLCPEHHRQDHHPSFMFNTGNNTIYGECSCGAAADLTPTTQETVIRWWQEHVISSPSQPGEQV